MMVLRPVRIIALNTFRELIRDRILYGIVVFALLLFGFSLVLGQLSFSEQARISADFGFSGIQLASCILAIFAGSTLVGREIEKQTVLTLLARPVSRTQFLLGKFIGLAMVVAVVMALLSLVLAGLMVFLEFKLNREFAVALLGIYSESLILIATALFFGVLTKPALTVIDTIAVFLMGHWVGSLDFFSKKSTSASFKWLAKIVQAIIPDLERFNWRSAPVDGFAVPASEILQSIGYMTGWLIILLCLTAIFFRRRDFV